MGGPGSGRHAGSSKKYINYKNARKLAGGGGHKITRNMARRMSFYAKAGFGSRGIKRNMT